MTALKYDRKTGFLCPNCGQIEYVLGYQKIWVCYELRHCPESEYEYERLEEKDVPMDEVEYECPKCGEVFCVLEEEE